MPASWPLSIDDHSARYAPVYSRPPGRPRILRKDLVGLSSEPLIDPFGIVGFPHPMLSCWNVRPSSQFDPITMPHVRGSATAAGAAGIGAGPSRSGRPFCSCRAAPPLATPLQARAGARRGLWHAAAEGTRASRSTAGRLKANSPRLRKTARGSGASLRRADSSKSHQFSGEGQGNDRRSARLWSRRAGSSTRAQPDQIFTRHARLTPRRDQASGGANNACMSVAARPGNQGCGRAGPRLNRPRRSESLGRSTPVVFRSLWLLGRKCRVQRRPNA